MSNKIYRGRYCADAGSVALATQDVVVSFDNRFGDGFFNLTILPDAEAFRGFIDSEMEEAKLNDEYWEQPEHKGSFDVKEDGKVGVLDYDCGSTVLFSFPEGHYSVYARDGDIYIVRDDNDLEPSISIETDEAAFHYFIGLDKPAGVVVFDSDEKVQEFEDKQGYTSYFISSFDVLQDGQVDIKVGDEKVCSLDQSCRYPLYHNEHGLVMVGRWDDYGCNKEIDFSDAVILDFSDSSAPSVA